MSVDIVNIVLGVDSRQVKDGTEALGGLGKQSGETETATGKLSAALMGGVAAAAAAAVATYKVVQAAIDAADAMNDMHIKTGLSFQSLVAYDQLARQSGTSLEGVASGFKFLSKNLIENGATMAALGITAKDTDQAMAQFADIIAGISDPALKTALSMEVLGRSGTDLLVMLDGGSAAMEEARKSTKEYGDLLALVAPNADQFNDEMAAAATQTKYFALVLADYALPALLWIVQGIKDLFSVLNLVIQPIIMVGAALLMLAEIAIGKGAGAWDRYSERVSNAATSMGQSFEKLTADATTGGVARTKITKEEEEAIKKLMASKEASAASQKYIKSLMDEYAQVGMNANQKIMYDATQQKAIAGTIAEGDAIIFVAKQLVKANKAQEEKIRLKLLDEEISKNKTIAAIEEANIAVGMDPQTFKNIAAVESLRQRYGDEQSLSDEKYALDKVMLDQSLENKLISQQQHDALIEGMAVQKAAKDIDITKRTADAKNRIREAETAQALLVMNVLSTLMNSKNKEMFEIGKIASTASAIINTYEGATKALAQGGFWGIALAGAVIAAGFVQVANIQAQQFGGGTTGGASGMSSGGALSTGSFGQTVNPSTPAPQAQPIQISIYNTGTFVDAQAFVDNTIIPQIRDQITNSDVLLIDPRSRQAQVLGAA